MTVRMTHPEAGTYDAQPSQVEFLKASGWEPADPDADYDRWPTELQRFEGQPVVKMRHPQVEGDPIDAAESQVPFFQERGWQKVEDVQAQELEGLTVEQLKERARERGLKVSGSKDDLIERLSEPPAEQDEDQPAAPADQEDEA